MSRRAMLGVLGAGGLVALLTSCDGDGNPGANRGAGAGGAGGTGAMTELPDPLSPIPLKKSPMSDKEYAPPAPARPLPPAVTTREPENYGILPRSAWTKVGPDMKRVDPMDGVKLITFHHSGDPKVFVTTDYAETAQHLEYVREYHRSRNFQDIGYHFAIDRAGRVWQLRSLKFQGQHVRYNNEHNIGVVVLGNFDLQAMSSAQKEKVKAFAPLLRKQYGLSIKRVYTHKEIVSTECPGDDMQPFMVNVRKQGLI